MTRLRRIEKSGRIFFITTNIVRGQMALTAGERDLVLGTIGAQHAKGSFRLFGYVIMPDHLHLLLSPHGCDLPAAMRNIKSVAGFRVLWGRDREGPLWQDGYFDNILRRAKNFWEKLEYIHRNPVEAGLCGEPDEWRWSSYGAYEGAVKPAIPVDSIELPFDGDAYLWNAH